MVSKEYVIEKYKEGIRNAIKKNNKITSVVSDWESKVEAFVEMYFGKSILSTYNSAKENNANVGEVVDLILDSDEIIYPHFLFSNNTIRVHTIDAFTLYASDYEISYNPVVNVFASEIPKLYKISGGMIGKFTMQDEVAKDDVGLYRLTSSFDEEKAKNIIEASNELQGCFGKIDRQTGEYGSVQLFDIETLLPGDDVFPEDTLYPNDNSVDIFYPSSILKVKVEEEQTKPYDRVGLTFTDASGNDKYVYTELVDTSAPDYDPDNYQSYTMGWNYLIQNATTTEEVVDEIIATVAERVKNIRYHELEIDVIGRPYITAGDIIQFVEKKSRYHSYAMKITLSGVQTLKAKITS